MGKILTSIVPAAITATLTLVPSFTEGADTLNPLGSELDGRDAITPEVGENQSVIDIVVIGPHGEEKTYASLEEYLEEACTDRIVAKFPDGTTFVAPKCDSLEP